MMVQERSTEGVPARRRRVVAWLAVTMVALLIAAACGGDDDRATAAATGLFTIVLPAGRLRGAIDVELTRP